MSRNFELMAQLEIQAAVADGRDTAADERAAEMDDVPVLSRHPDNINGEEMLRFIQRIFLSANGPAPRQVVLCGVEDDNGSSSICAKAGQTLAANSSLPVCIVDANVRSLRLLSAFGLDSKTLRSSSLLSVREQCRKVAPNLWLAGPHILADNGRVLLPPIQLKERFAQFREEFEYVLIDAPAVSVCGDAQLLGNVADATILVVEANCTRRLAARKAKEFLEAAGVNVLGTVLHNRTFPIPMKLYKRLNA